MYNFFHSIVLVLLTFLLLNCNKIDNDSSASSFKDQGSLRTSIISDIKNYFIETEVQKNKINEILNPAF
jgi:hypothetical protein